MEDELKARVDQFILGQIDSVSHLEALLLLWSGKSKQWSAEEMAKALYVKAPLAEGILKDLAQRNLATITAGTPDLYSFDSASDERNRVIEALDTIYRREIVRISTLIHFKGSRSIREFAKAFRFTKDREP
jgi:hypothetical protein